jgi:uncharacterized phage protein (TIGR02218 family)
VPQLDLNSRTSYTTLWKLTPADGSAGFARTTGSREIVYNSTTYLPASLTPSQQQMVENLDASNLEVVLPLSEGGVSKQELLNGRWSDARVEIVIYDYEAQTAERVWRGILSDVDLDNGRLKAEALDIGVLLQQQIGDLYQELCRADFGDAKCGKTPQSDTVEVAAAVSRREFIVTHTLPSAYSYEFGIAEWVSGANAGLRKEIKSVAQEGALVRVKLVESMREEIAPGDTVALREGCDGRFETCIAKLNARRFRGEPRIPGLFKLLQFPS